VHGGADVDFGVMRDAQDLYAGSSESARVSRFWFKPFLSVCIYYCASVRVRSMYIRE